VQSSSPSSAGLPGQQHTARGPAACCYPSASSTLPLWTAAGNRCAPLGIYVELLSCSTHKVPQTLDLSKLSSSDLSSSSDLALIPDRLHSAVCFFYRDKRAGLLPCHRGRALGIPAQLPGCPASPAACTSARESPHGHRQLQAPRTGIAWPTRRPARLGWKRLLASRTSWTKTSARRCFAVHLPGTVVINAVSRLVSEQGADKRD